MVKMYTIVILKNNARLLYISITKKLENVCIYFLKVYLSFV